MLRRSWALSRQRNDCESTGSIRWTSITSSDIVELVQRAETWIAASLKIVLQVKRELRRWAIFAHFTSRGRELETSLSKGRYSQSNMADPWISSLGKTSMNRARLQSLMVFNRLIITFAGRPPMLHRKTSPKSTSAKTPVFQRRQARKLSDTQLPTKISWQQAD